MSDDESLSRIQKRGRASSAAALLIYCSLALVLFASTWRNPGGRWIGLDGDPDSTMWSIEWSAFSVLHHLNPFVTDHIFYPAGTTVMWANADAPLALGWAALPVTVLLGPIVAYNVLQTLALGLSAWTAFIAIRPLVKLDVAAFLGALVYGFGPYMLAHSYGHLGLTVGVVPPLVMWLLYRLVVTREGSAVWIGAAAGLLVAFQFLVTSELVVTETVMAVVALAWVYAVAWLTRAKVPWREVWPRILVAGAEAIALFAILAAYPVYELIHGPGRITEGPVRQFGVYSTDLANLVVPAGQTNLIRTPWTEQLSQTFIGGPPESSAYLGLGLLLVIFVSVVLWGRERAVLFAGGALVIALVASLGPNVVYEGAHHGRLILPWVVFTDVPILNNVLPARLTIYVDLFAGVVLALFIDKGWSQPHRLAKPGVGIACAVSLALLLPSWPWISSTAHVPPLFQPGTTANRTLRVLVPQDSVAVILPPGFTRPDQGYATLWQATAEMSFKMPDGDLFHGDAAGKPTLDPAPSPLWDAVAAVQHGKAPPSSEADLAQVRAQLQAIKARAVVIGPMDHQDAAAAYFTLLIGRAPEAMGGTLVWFLG